MTMTLCESIETFSHGLREATVDRWKQEETARMKDIASIACSEASISLLIERLGLELLLETLDLDEQTFHELYPNLSLGPIARKEIKQAVMEHFEMCGHCQLIAENHRWADAQLDIVIAHEKLKRSSARVTAKAIAAKAGI